VGESVEVLTSFNVPNLDGIIVRGTSKNIGSDGVEKNVANFSRVASEFPNRSDVLNFLGVLKVQGVVVGNSPNGNSAVIRTRGKDLVVKRVPKIKSQPIFEGRKDSDG